VEARFGPRGRDPTRAKTRTASFAGRGSPPSTNQKPLLSQSANQSREDAGRESKQGTVEAKAFFSGPNHDIKMQIFTRSWVYRCPATAIPHQACQLGRGSLPVGRRYGSHLIKTLKTSRKFRPQIVVVRYSVRGRSPARVARRPRPRERRRIRNQETRCFFALLFSSRLGLNVPGALSCVYFQTKSN
jgi:hypothetical protein